MTRCFIACGANIPGLFGEPQETLGVVFSELPKYNLRILKKSRLYSSVAFPDPKKPYYLNGCLELQVHCKSSTVLDCLKSIERKMGRGKGERWDSRICDLDLLAFSNEIRPSADVFDQWYRMPLRVQMTEKPSELLLPHPRLQDRAFVLKPLMEFASDWIHPILKISVKDMFEALPKEDQDSVVPI